MATHQKVSFREVDALYVEDISYTGW